MADRDRGGAGEGGEVQDVGGAVAQGVGEGVSED